MKLTTRNLFDFKKDEEKIDGNWITFGMKQVQKLYW